VSAHILHIVASAMLLNIGQTAFPLYILLSAASWNRSRRLTPNVCTIPRTVTKFEERGFHFARPASLEQTTELTAQY